MVFSSAVFLFAYLACVLLGYYFLPRKYQLYFLFVLNLVFYGWGEPVYVLIMVLSIVINYAGGLLVTRLPRRRKAVLIFTVFVDLALLGFFKYTNFILSNVNALFSLSIAPLDITLPIGISFYTFQSMSYVIDVYRGDTGPQRNPFVFGTYVALFPQLIAGPIVRYRDVEAELKQRSISLDDVTAGVERFIVGLAKKVLLANAMGQFWETIAAAPATSGILGSWAGIIAYTFQIYFDFSGYSDMAIGLGRMLGFHFLENFNYPYIAASITDFWRRWHISLSTWFREYVYIPLGGNRRGVGRQLLNICIVWALTGLWHGASWNFVLWGVYFAVLLIMEKLFMLKALSKAPAFVGHIYALLLIVLGWALFYFDKTGALLVFLRSLFVPGGELISPEALRGLLAYLPMMVVCGVASTPLLKNLIAKAKGNGGAALRTVLCVLLLLLCIAAIVSDSYNPFIYFRF